MDYENLPDAMPRRIYQKRINHQQMLSANQKLASDNDKLKKALSESEERMVALKVYTSSQSQKYLKALLYAEEGKTTHTRIIKDLQMAYTQLEEQVHVTVVLENLSSVTL